MDHVEAKDRLRSARLAAGLSRRALASRVGISESALRAHENGQNGIKPEAAARYGAQLNVSPAWILYGQHDTAFLGEITGNELKRIPVIGRVRDGIFKRQSSSPQDPLHYIGAMIPNAKSLDLQAYIFQPEDDESFFTKYLIVASPASIAPVPGDEVVVQMEVKGNLAEIGLWTVIYPGRNLSLRRGDGRARQIELGSATWDGSYNDSRVLGVVVARLDLMRAESITARRPVDDG